jgi:hypothetical protein
MFASLILKTWFPATLVHMETGLPLQARAEWEGISTIISAKLRPLKYRQIEFALCLMLVTHVQVWRVPSVEMLFPFTCAGLLLRNP